MPRAGSQSLAKKELCEDSRGKTERKRWKQCKPEWKENEVDGREDMGGELGNLAAESSVSGDVIFI